MILHLEVKVVDKARPMCFVCRARPKSILTCAFCGEMLCADPCFRLFHRELFVFSGAHKETPLKDFTLDSDVESVDDAGEDVDESAGEDEDVEESVDKEEGTEKAASSKGAHLTPVQFNRGHRKLDSKTKSNPKRQKKN